jgi:hypothetical protein
VQEAPTRRSDVLPPDVARALLAAAARLQRQLPEGADPALVELLLAERYAALARQARITQYLPVLAERAVRQDLRSVAGPPGPHPRSRGV